MGVGHFVVQVCRRDYAAMEVTQIQFFVRRMGVLVRQTHAKEHGRQSKDFLESGDHRDRSTLTIEHRRLTEALLYGTARRLDKWIVELGHPRLAAVHPRDL